MTGLTKGSLIVVGTGIDVWGQMTLIAKEQIENADIVFEVVYGPAAKAWIASLNSNVVCLTDLYAEGKSRAETYEQMEDAIVEAVMDGKRVVAAFYGHPGIFVMPTHKAIARLRAKGYEAHMEPGVSAEDCLVADLGIDPAQTGCQTFEATQLLFYNHHIEPSCLLIIWQIGIVGEHTLRTVTPGKYGKALAVLTDLLLESFPDDHEVILYEAANQPLFSRRIERLPLDDLRNRSPSGMSTLVVPGYGKPEYNVKRLAKLGLTVENVRARTPVD
ncbi:MAG: hypothetical protein JKY60_01020 [Kordiimonadaceae bacterium]|nr:hypothetical protein [Kordiimonadaceae bacterium]